MGLSRRCHLVGHEADEQRSVAVKHRNYHLTCKSTPRYIPKTSENIHPYKNLYMKVYNSIIHNSQELQTTPMKH